MAPSLAKLGRVLRERLRHTPVTALCCGGVLALLVVAAFMVFYGSLFGHLIVGIGKQKIMTWFYAADALVSVSLYFILIPRYGATAAALVTIFSEAVIASQKHFKTSSTSQPDLIRSPKRLLSSVTLTTFPLCAIAIPFSSNGWASTATGTIPI